MTWGRAPSSLILLSIRDASRNTAAVQPMVDLALQHRPETATLVPERREELTTEGGLDVVSSREEIRRVARALRDAGLEVSLFVDPDLEQVKAKEKLLGGK